MEDLVYSIKRGNPGSVKTVLASVVLALAAYQVILAAIGYGKLRLMDARPAFFTHRASGDAIVVVAAVVGFLCLAGYGVDAEMVYKVNEARPNCVDLIKNGKIDIIFNTPLGRESFYADTAIRKSATLHGVLVVTTLTAAAATVRAIQALRERALDIVSLQEIHARARAAVR